MFLVQRSVGFAIGVRVAVFFGLLLGCQLLWQNTEQTQVRRAVIQTIVVAPAARAIAVLTPQLGAHAQGASIVTTQGAISVRKGCDGVELHSMILAVFLALPLPIGRRISGVLFGEALVYLLNQLRIITLFYASLWKPDAFNSLHTTVLPTLLVVVLGLFVCVWSSRSAHARMA